MNTSDIIESIDGRLEEIRGEIASLEQARSELVNGTRAAVPVRRPRKRGKSRRRPARAERAKPTQVDPAGVLERLLEQSDGLTTAALANKADADRAQVLALLKELEAEGRVRRSGVRRGTRWRRFTEEDAIAERAAELAARSKSRARKRPAASR